MEPEAAPKTAAERLEAADRHREAGNASFKAGEVQAAKESYQSAVSLLEAAGDVSAEEAARKTTCHVSVLLNLALCELKAGEAGAALDACEQVLDLDPENAKAMFRKAKALIELDELKEAEWELVRACKLMPKDAAIRKELDQLRQRAKDSKAKEKRMFTGFLEKGAGFASDNREATARSMRAAEALANSKYDYFHDDKENPYEEMERPQDAAVELSMQGRLDDAVLAWEAALARSAIKKEWMSHYCFSLELGRVLMDVNNDDLALRCFNKVIDPPDTEGEDEAQPLPPMAPAELRRDAMLLRSICLINDDGGDPAKTVPASLEEWMRELLPAAPGGGEAAEGAQPSLDERLSTWLREHPADAGADAAVALGLLQLMGGQETAWQPLVDALLADSFRGGSDEGDAARASCFYGPRRYPTRWNMLGAVLANKGRYDQAKQAYQQALKLQPHYPRALSNYAIALSAGGDHLGAARCYVEALRIVPRWATPSFWPLLQKAARDHGQLEGLVEAVEQENLTKVCQLLDMSSAAPPAAVSIDDSHRPEPVLTDMGLSAGILAES